MTTTAALPDEIKVELPERKLLINNRWVESVSSRALHLLITIPFGTTCSRVSALDPLRAAYRQPLCVSGSQRPR
jgi:hypothetical protein